ncbi:hypothetical protein LTS15_002118 [Exophiala xenobiotica]|nr:hypothetical protein LTS15_002118 [Exophiala xenobiotica]
MVMESMAMESEPVVAVSSLSRSNASFTFTSRQPSSLYSAVTSLTSSGPETCSISGVAGTALCSGSIKNSSMSTTKMTTSSYNPAGTTLPPISITGFATASDLPDGSTLRIFSIPASSEGSTSSSGTTTNPPSSSLTLIVTLSASPSIGPSTTAWSIAIISSSSASVALQTSTTTSTLPLTTSSPGPTTFLSSFTSSTTTPFSASISTAQSNTLNPLTESILTSVPVHTTTSAPMPQNASGPPLSIHGHHGPGSHVAVVLAIPLALLFTGLVVGLFFLWRRFFPLSYYESRARLPGYAALRRWKDTRDRNRRTRELRTSEGLTAAANGSNNEMTSGDTFTRRLRQYEQESARAREKFSFEAPTTPLSGKKSGAAGPSGNGNGSHSPWYKSPSKSKIASPKMSHDTPRADADMGIMGVGGGRRKYGPFKRDFNEETGSLESWEEKWFNLGNNEGEGEGQGESSESSKTNLRKGVFEGRAERVSGPGMSWRKLI